MARTPMTLRTAYVVALVCVGTGPVLAFGQSHYFYFKEQRPLTLDASRIAFKVNASSGAAAAPDLARYGIDAATIERFPVATWRTARPVDAQRTFEGIHQAVDQISTDGAADFVSPVFVGDDGGPVIVTPTLLVGFHAGVDKARAEAILRDQGAGDILERDWANMHNTYKLRAKQTNGFDVLDTANALAQLPEVKFAEPDMMFTGRGGLIPNDTRFSELWGLHNTGQSGGLPDFDMDAPEAWNITTGDPSILVLVLDTGVQQDHPDINQITPGIDTTTDFGDGGPVNECDNHGTAVAGCVSAMINNHLGVVGSCPNCRVASARPFISNASCDGSWTSSASWTVDALDWGESIGARVSNNSNIYGFTASSIATKYESTRNIGMVHFACAGNDSSGFIAYPSSLPTVNSVAASDRFGDRAGFSNWGVGLAFTAPGLDIGTTDRTGADGWVIADYVTAWGTSFSSPYTAGVAGLILSMDPNLSAAEVEQLMQQGAVDLGASGYDTGFGWGHVNALASLPRGCVNDFAAATTSPSGGAGGDRVSRFACAPASLAPGGTTAVRVTLKKMYNTTPGDPDGASVCPAGRTAPSLSQFETKVRWLAAPTAVVDDALPPGPDYIVAPLVCTAAAAEVRDWSLAAMAGDFPSANASGVFFFGVEVVPCSVYEIAHCSDPLDEATCQDPILVRTGVLADNWPPFAPTPGQPAFTDINAAVNKYKSIPFSPGTTPMGGPPEWHALVRGNIVADYDVSTVTTVNFIDINITVASYKSIPYNQNGPCDPDTATDNCGDPCDTDP